MPIKFECIMNEGKTTENWSGMITSLTKFRSHYELRIESRSGFIVIIGKTNYGNFACIPYYDAGCHLCNFEDLFWNSERLSAIMNKIDGITVPYALKTVAEYIDLN